MKRIVDLLLSLTALAILALPMLVTAIVIRLSDGGPALYRQERVGMNGRSFDIFKFRSMIANADLMGGYATASDDVRITRVGKFLRRTSIDELPQLLNVLRGDMSLVGPRPDVPAQQALYAPADWTLRHTVRPGVTGLAQATFRSAATQNERTRLDLQYVRSPGAWEDLRIMLLTARRLFARSGN